MKNKIVAINGEHLIKLIQEEINLNGNQCDLNHIDISKITHLNRLFEKSDFNGDISQWDTSNVKDMYKMFYESKFNGDISKWDVSNVENMDFMFAKSEFRGSIENWTPYKLEIINPIKLFGTLQPPVIIPYWANYKEPDTRLSPIKVYHFKKKLNEELNEKFNDNPKNKKPKL